MSQWDWVYSVENKIGKFVLCQRQETYRGLTAEPAMRISGIVLLHFIFSMQYSSSSRVLICIREVDGASPSIAEKRSVAQLVEQQPTHGKGPNAVG